MKKLHLIIFMLSACFSSYYAQEWAPVGAKWHFTKHYTLSSEVSFSMIEVEKDTVVEGKNCKKIVGDFDNCIWKSQFMYESNDSVYFYHTPSNKFEMLYDFGANPGDTWEIPNITTNFGLSGADTTQLIVDSVGQKNISGETLKVIYTTQLNPSKSGFEFGGTIIEKIGSPTMFPYFFACEPVAGNLRCYEDNTISYQIDGIVSCEYSNLNTTQFSLNELKVYPNPIPENTFTIQADNNLRIDQVKLYDNLGKEIEIKYSMTPTGITCAVSTPHLSKGFYTVEIVSDKGIYKHKIVIQ